MKIILNVEEGRVPFMVARVRGCIQPSGAREFGMTQIAFLCFRMQNCDDTYQFTRRQKNAMRWWLAVEAKLLINVSISELLMTSVECDVIEYLFSAF